MYDIGKIIQILHEYRLYNIKLIDSKIGIIMRDGIIIRVKLIDYGFVRTYKDMI